ncbi:MAG: gluconate 2-dehydrogenase subunit 3 family protein [Saprospiraceae bacterium]
MKRRDSIKTIALGSLTAAGLLQQSCKTDLLDRDTMGKASEAGNDAGPARTPEEIAYYKEITSNTFFTVDEMATITLLADMIIPKDEKSGSASDAGVPDFIEFIVKDQPNHQVPMRGGLRWLDLQCLHQYQKTCKDCTEAQRKEMVDKIAFPKKAGPEMSQGVSFFNLIRNLVTTGFYTSSIGIKDLEYKGNIPNQWNGVPDDVLKAHGLAYTEKELKECI